MLTILLDFLFFLLAYLHLLGRTIIHSILALDFLWQVSRRFLCIIAATPETPAEASRETRHKSRGFLWQQLAKKRGHWVLPPWAATPCVTGLSYATGLSLTLPGYSETPSTPTHTVSTKSVASVPTLALADLVWYSTNNLSGQCCQV